jgi:hypothetical protein
MTDDCIHDIEMGSDQAKIRSVIDLAFRNHDGIGGVSLVMPTLPTEAPSE